MDKKEKHVQQLLEKLVNPNHKKDIINYISIRKEVDKANSNTISIDVTALYHLSRFLNSKNFKDATRTDIRNWSNWLTKQNLGETSINAYQMKIKRFYKYIADPNRYENGKMDQKDILYPDCVRWISYINAENELPLDSIPSSKDILKLLKSCKDAREQSILCSLIDGGLRDNELRAMKIRNVNFDKTLGVYFLLPKKKRGSKKTIGLKTGQRKIQLFLIPSSTAIIKDYLNHHPLKDNPDAPFIITENTRITSSIYKKINTGEATIDDINKLSLSENGVNQILERIEKKSGFKYHLYPHFLRHISATLCAGKGFNEPMLRERFGWSRSSKMPSRYVHITDETINTHIKQAMGIKDETPRIPDELQPIICWNCGFENPCTNKFCGKCSAKLKPTLEEMTATATDTGIVTQDALKDPEFREFYNEILAKTFQMYKEMKEKQK